MSEHNERLARLGLTLLTEPGDARVAALVDERGPVEVFDRLRRDPALASSPRAQESPAGVLERAHSRGLRFLVPGDDEWPVRLGDLASTEPVVRMGGTPLGLWVRGPLGLRGATESSVGIVGSRSATTYGAHLAGGLAADLAEVTNPAPFTVVSGAAFGIDVAAHRGALAVGGPTVAVLACGVDRIYPTAHRDLLNHLGEHGLVVSELPPGSAPTRFRFLARNRLIAALTQGTVVVEAAVRSGALSTANWAAQLNRPVMGVPGPVTSASSEGVHELLRIGAATLVSSGAHVREILSPIGVHLVEPARSEPSARDRLSVVERRTLEAVPLHQPASAESISIVAGLTLEATRAALGTLAGAGWAESDGTRWRQRSKPVP